MKHLNPKIIKVNSAIEYNYLTIKVTQSRIDKGLLSIPVSLIDVFPHKKQKIKVYFDDNENYSELNFTPYSSSSRECRIGGMKDWFNLHKVNNNEELVIQIIEEDKYEFRLFTEKQYLHTIKLLRSKFDNSYDDITTTENINKLAAITNKNQSEVLENEFYRLSKQSDSNRNFAIVARKKSKESVPYSIRKILEEIYKGKCQLSNFTFIQKNGNPYFEIHHIKENKGNYLKNLLVVSPNIHAQFTYSRKKEYFDDNGWLRKVNFNKNEFSVNQFIDKIDKRKFIKEVHQ